MKKIVLSRRAKYALAAGVLAAALALACLFFAGSRYMLVSHYDEELAAAVFKDAGYSYGMQMDQCAQINRLLDASGAGYTAEFASAYREYAQDAQWEQDRLISEADHLVQKLRIMDHSGSVAAWSGRSADIALGEHFFTQAGRKAKQYEIYARRLNELLEDGQTPQADIEAYRLQLSEVVQADMLVSASMYQLICRGLVSQKVMQQEGYPDPYMLAMLEKEQQEELLYLSREDLVRIYQDRLKDFWVEEYRLSLLL